MEKSFITWPSRYGYNITLCNSQVTKAVPLCKMAEKNRFSSMKIISPIFSDCQIYYFIVIVLFQRFVSPNYTAGNLNDYLTRLTTFGVS